MMPSWKACARRSTMRSLTILVSAMPASTSYRVATGGDRSPTRRARTGRSLQAFFMVGLPQSSRPQREEPILPTNATLERRPDMPSLHPSYAFVADWNDSPPLPAPTRGDFQRRALSIWPGLDRGRLRRAHGDPWKIATLVAARTSLTLESILVLLMASDDPPGMTPGGGRHTPHGRAPHDGADEAASITPMPSHSRDAAPGH